jgi:transcriptional regulator with XRE-family HTH domain
MKKKWAEYIRRARAVKGLSQQNLADDMKISVVSYSKIERGLTELSVARLVQIAELLDMDVTPFINEKLLENATPPVVVNAEESSIQYGELDLNVEFVKVLTTLSALQQEILNMKNEISELRAKVEKRNKAEKRKDSDHES